MKRAEKKLIQTYSCIVPNNFQELLSAWREMRLNLNDITQHAVARLMSIMGRDTPVVELENLFKEEN